jgi:hypothetical protein
LFQNPVGFETTSWKSGQIGLKSGPLFPIKLRLLFQKLKFWNSLIEQLSLKNACFAALEPKVRWRETARLEANQRLAGSQPGY